MGKSSKRGRPRKETTTGPTPERLAKDERAVNDAVFVLRERGEIDADQEHVLERFRECHSAFLAGWATARGQMFDPSGRANPEPTRRDEVLSQAYREAVDILKGVGRQTFDAVVNTAVYRRYPWRNVPKITQGVNALKTWAERLRVLSRAA
jgi:hypothetical protein